MYETIAVVSILSVGEGISVLGNSFVCNIHIWENEFTVYICNL